MTAPIDFRAVFDRANAPFMVLDRDFRYVDANRAYLAEVGRAREEIIGRLLFEAFPEQGEPRRLLEESLQRVLRDGAVDHLPLIPYAIRDPSGELMHRFWSATHTPLFDAAGQVAYILQNTQDVTEVHRLRAAAGALASDRATIVDADIWRRAEAVQQVNDRLQLQLGRLRELFMQAPSFMAVLSGPEHIFELANHAYARLVGHRELVGKPLAKAIPEVVDQGFVELLDGVRATGEPYIGRAAKVLLEVELGAGLQERFLDFIYQPMTDERGDVTGVFVEGFDVTDRLRAQQQERLLINELNHRVKNTLATVQAIASQTLRQGMEPAAFAATFQARVAALSQTHNVLTATQWQGASLRRLLEQELSPYGAQAVQLTGEDVRLPPRTALSLGLVFHELTTNAAKYGALSSAGGRVEVALRQITRDGRGWLSITWTETGGPPVTAPARRGFGTRLIERSVQGELDGELQKDFRPQGLVCTIRIPLESQPPESLI